MEVTEAHQCSGFEAAAVGVGVRRCCSAAAVHPDTAAAEVVRPAEEDIAVGNYRVAAEVVPTDPIHFVRQKDTAPTD